MAVKQTTMISANITAYSTAVGPSSDFRNSRIFLVRYMINPQLRLGSHPRRVGSVMIENSQWRGDHIKWLRCGRRRNPCPTVVPAPHPESIQSATQKQK